ncbi:MAG TPA: GNAT family protein [Mucilaginibacter sp.]|nr:GNAT family protein [Mucilaginibacter sp.]
MELRGDGFILRGWKKGDEISLQRNADNPNVSRYLMDRFPYPYPMEAAVAWVNTQVGQSAIQNFAIDINGDIAGGMAIELKEDVHRKTGVIGYWLAEQYWGQGIMTEAVKLLTAYAFQHFDLVRIQAAVYSKNHPSMRVLEKAGYHKEAVLHNSVYKNGELLDEHIYAILK